MSKRVPFKLGSDPEFILLKNGQPFSAEGVIGHGKFDPLDLGNQVIVHEDNILVEFNISPANSMTEFLKNNIKAVYTIHKKFLKDKELLISKECYAEFDAQALATEQAQSVGCSPEFDAITGEMLDPPKLAAVPARTAGGHVHIGYPNENLFESMAIIKTLDLYLGIPSLILDPDKKRRALYGKASSFRRTDGVKVEYRTLSNFWLFDKDLMEWVWNVVDKVVNDVLSGVILDDDLYLRVRETINTNNEEEARKIIAETPDMILPKGNSLDILEKIYADDAFLKEFIDADIAEIADVIDDEEMSEFDRKEQAKSIANKQGRRKRFGGNKAIPIAPKAPEPDFGWMEAPQDVVAAYKKKKFVPPPPPIQDEGILNHLNKLVEQNVVEVPQGIAGIDLEEAEAQAFAEYFAQLHNANEPV